MNEVVRSAWSNATCNGDFVCVETWSGYRSSMRDPQGKQYLLSPDISVQELGAALLDALAHSRFVLPAEDLNLYDYKQGIERNATWIADLMTRYGYKTKRALFKDMKSCNVRSQGGVITIRPSKHEKLESWSGDGISEGDYVVLPANSSAEEVGKALQLAFSRCIG
ncbi:contact-dependent growth inhibition system immunity protein [Andreprevotia chitinilytica]|uniref:contact-dependent growth inhibition system immunity protein n=1 Tax=Andreprevotia chitinilytica TaxID=396808 RepID=UPI000559442E|nr:contact-dependent growth inhibition system immunity protein [Andreprevotia chitinilytica]